MSFNTEFTEVTETFNSDTELFKRNLKVFSQSRATVSSRSLCAEPWLLLSTLYSMPSKNSVCSVSSVLKTNLQTCQTELQTTNYKQ